MTDVYLEPWRFAAHFHVDEDPSSLALRMAALGSMNGEQFLRFYLKNSGLDGVVASKSMLQRLAIISSTPLHLLTRNAFVWSGGKAQRDTRKEIPFRSLLLRSRSIAPGNRLAPGVLKADGHDLYGRLAWRFAMLPGDPITGEVLLSRCPKCLDSLSWHAEHFCVCAKCRFDIRQTEPLFLSEEEKASTGALADALGLLDGANPKPLVLPEPFSDLALAEQIDALVWLAEFRGKLESTLLSPTVANAYMGLPLAQNWPRTLALVTELMFRQTSGPADEVTGGLIALFNCPPLRAVSARIAQQLMAHAQAHSASYTRWHGKRGAYTTLPLLMHNTRVIPEYGPTILGSGPGPFD